MRKDFTFTDLRLMSKHYRQITFVDAFAGCGGLSLGLLQAGMKGLFAIEHDGFAFETLRENLIDGQRFNFGWPDWLPVSAISIEDFISQYSDVLRGVRGSVDLLVGGPPCQGFSSAGRRKHDDPRNQLFSSYVKLVEYLDPTVLLLENVRGFTMDFRRKDHVDNYAGKLRELLASRYDVYEDLIDLSQFGVPQLRTRYFLIAFKPEICRFNPFDNLKSRLPSYLRSLGLQTPVSSWAAISDLEIGRGGTRPSSETPGFDEIRYAGPLTHYQKLMGTGTNSPSNLRLARHAPNIAARFQDIIALSHAEGRLNTTISESVRAKYGIKKRALRVLDPDRPSPTITSMPDDLLHYSEPRTLTVRENARLQGFPDWFEFKGKYTTGGDLRRREVPRFTQVANAVPPLVARAIGEMLIDLLSRKKAMPDVRSRRWTKDLMEAAELSA